jgi:hypothetical protein
MSECRGHARAGDRLLFWLYRRVLEGSDKELGSFDLILMMGVLHHLDDTQAAATTELYKQVPGAKGASSPKILIVALVDPLLLNSF